jgi:hypothetical protein
MVVVVCHQVPGGPVMEDTLGAGDAPLGAGTRAPLGARSCLAADG